MSALRQFARARHGLALVWLALALAARLMMPTGFMPVNDGGGMTMVPCSGSGPMAMAGHGMHHDKGHAPQSRHDHPCTFSALGAALSEPWAFGTVLERLPAAATPLLAAPAAPAAIGRGLAAPPPPPTGPPTLA